MLLPWLLLGLVLPLHDAVQVLASDSRLPAIELFVGHRLKQWRDEIDVQLVATVGGLGVLLVPTLMERVSKAFTATELRLILAGSAQPTGNRFGILEG